MRTGNGRRGGVGREGGREVSQHAQHDAYTWEGVKRGRRQREGHTK